MATAPTAPFLSRWELAAETIAVKIRWFGLLFGYVLVNAGTHPAPHPLVLNAILGLGAVYAVLDTACSLRGRVFLGRWPLLTSLMEALFIALLCFYHGGLDSPFRYYYLLSLICCAIRYSPRVTYATCALHCTSYGLLYLASPPGQERFLVLTLVMLGWVTWASTALALLLRGVGERLGRLNAALEEHQAQLEARIEERTRELHEAQAHVLHQEKMAAFGLLAAGIAHEVGNPLTSISSLVQLLQRRDADPYTQEKLALVSGQLQRIQTTLRELINFSRPASTERTRVDLNEILQEALNIAKYYSGPGGRNGRLARRNGASARERPAGRSIGVHVDDDVPPLSGVRDQLVQAFLNLVLNAIDATARGGRIDIRAACRGEGVEVTVQDDGQGIPPEHAARLFQPYFTTKKHGTGLGLFVTRKLLADHGGTVGFTPAPEGGTAFRVWLPLAPEPVIPEAPLSHAPPAGEGPVLLTRER
jgi:signal transduction histidine kinase